MSKDWNLSPTGFMGAKTESKPQSCRVSLVFDYHFSVCVCSIHRRLSPQLSFHDHLTYGTVKVRFAVSAVFSLASWKPWLRFIIPIFGAKNVLPWLNFPLPGPNSLASFRVTVRSGDRRGEVTGI